MNKKYWFLILLAIITINIKPVLAEDFSNIITNSDPSESEEVDDNNLEILNSFYYVNEETNYTAKIEDDASLLSLEQKNQLFEQMKPLTKYGHIAFVSTIYNTSSVESFSEEYYHRNYFTESGTIFVIDMKNRMIYIFSDGNNYGVITKSKAYSITDNSYTYATRGDYYGCASETFSEIGTLLEGRKISEPMRYTSNAFIALTLAFFISFLFVLRKSKITKATPKSIIKNCNITFNILETSAEKTGTHSEYSPVSDSGGSSGGGGGGGSSGGGGGHSF